MRIIELSVNSGNRIDIVSRLWGEKSGVRTSKGVRNFFALHRELTSSEFHASVY
jgi:hypothetical protein